MFNLAFDILVTSLASAGRPLYRQDMGQAPRSNKKMLHAPDHPFRWLSAAHLYRLSRPAIVRSLTEDQRGFSLQQRFVLPVYRHINLMSAPYLVTIRFCLPSPLLLAGRIAAVHRHGHVPLFAAHVLPICSCLGRVEVGKPAHDGAKIRQGKFVRAGV